MFLLSAPNLVALKLKSISENDYIPTETIVRSLATLTRLETLSITFYEASPPDQNESRLDLTMRAILPALTNFRYRGYYEYLEDFLAQITTPRLDNLRIEYYADDIKASQLSQFINHTENLKLSWFKIVKVMFYPLATFVQLDCLPECHQAWLILDFLDVEWLDEQVPYVTNVLGQLVATFSNVDHLSSHGDHVDSIEMESTDWLPFFHLFQAVKVVHLSGGVAAYIVSALEEATDKMAAEVLPALDLIWLDEEGNQESDRPVGPIERFLSLRQLSGRPVTVMDMEDEFFEADPNPV